MFDNKTCLVKDPITNFTLNLSDLSLEEKPFDTPETIVLNFNLCNKLEGGCGTDRNASACSRKDDKNHTLGESLL